MLKDLPAPSEGQLLAAQPARRANIEAICAYFASGVKQKQTGALGIELEHHIVHENGLTAVPYDDPHGSRWILEQAAASGWFPTRSCTPEGDLIGVEHPADPVAGTVGATLTLEPAAQLELSAGPYLRLADACRDLQQFAAQLEELLTPEGLKALPLGYHPTAKARQLQLIPKQRYDLMNAYLSSKSPFGPCMMRGSAATQVSIDYTSEADCVRKMRLGALCAPLFGLMCANAPVFEGSRRSTNMSRTLIWLSMDADRCCAVPGSATEGFSWEDYARWILAMPAIVAPGTVENEAAHVAPDAGWHGDNRPFGEIYATMPMTQADVEHALSMAFPDIRLKRYLEFRPADAMPGDLVVAYAALVRGLFCTEAGMAGMEELFDGVTEAAITEAKVALMQTGYEAQVYGRPATQLCDTLIGLAGDALGDEAASLEPLADLVKRRLTPAQAYPVA